MRLPKSASCWSTARRYRRRGRRRAAAATAGGAVAPGGAAAAAAARTPRRAAAGAGPGARRPCLRRRLPTRSAPKLSRAASAASSASPAPPSRPRCPPLPPAARRAARASPRAAVVRALTPPCSPRIFRWQRRKRPPAPSRPRRGVADVDAPLHRFLRSKWTSADSIGGCAAARQRGRGRWMDASADVTDDASSDVMSPSPSEPSTARSAPSTAATTASTPPQPSIEALAAIMVREASLQTRRLTIGYDAHGQIKFDLLEQMPIPAAVTPPPQQAMPPRRRGDALPLRRERALQLVDRADDGGPRRHLGPRRRGARGGDGAVRVRRALPMPPYMLTQEDRRNCRSISKAARRCRPPAPSSRCCTRRRS